MVMEEKNTMRPFVTSMTFMVNIFCENICVLMISKSLKDKAI